ncbi:MAG: Hsp20/alpha crystallin family protein [Gemmatimonadetes bacterium]|nr:Hsp20/alpha crystallin family protein [Gemmatimonadota bacterium]
MTLVRYPAWRELDEMTNRLARMFDDAAIRRSNAATFAPAVSVAETADALVITAELPGLTEKDVTIELENDVLSISGEKTEEHAEGDEERKYHLWERSYGSFRRSFSLPRTVVGAEATARFDQGVLEIRLPKAAEAKGRKIEISKN